MGSISKRLEEFQKVYDDMKNYVPALMDFDKLMTGRFPRHQNAAGYIDLHGVFYAAFEGVPTVNLPLVIMDQLKEFEKVIRDSIAGLKVYQEKQLKIKCEISQAHNEGWCDGYDVGLDEKTANEQLAILNNKQYWDGYTEGIVQGKEEKEIEIYEMKLMTFLHKIWGL